MTKKPDRKKRIEHIHATTSEEVDHVTLTFDQRTGEIRFAEAMTNVYSQISYERPKGPKVLSRIPQTTAGITFDPSSALFKNHDFLCAVDTNTRVLAGKEISVSAVVTFVRAPPPPGAIEHWKLDVPFCWEFVGLKTEKRENFGWLVVLEKLNDLGIIKSTTSVGMIVDSDLGNLPDYNCRRKPVFENSFLPSNVTLIYASADSGKENLVNRVIAVADFVATQVIDALASGKTPPNNETRDNPWYDAIRLINPNLKAS